LVGSTLTILHNPYLQGKLTAAGQSVTLTIDFGICTRTLVVSAIDTSVSVCANISPIANVYDLDNPGDVTTLITWNDSPKSITSIFDGTSNLTSGTHYTVSGHDGTAVLTIKNAYLTGKLTTAGQSVVLTIRFPDDCVATFTITAYRAAAECITVSSSTRQYDLANPGDVSTTITDWGTVSTITSIHDNGTGFLTPGTHYTVVGNTLTIRTAYLASKLTAPGQSVVLTINCDPICAVPFTIMALGTPTTCASISPTVRQYDLANRASQTTTITWNSASSITSIVDNGGTLTTGTHYTVVGNTLTILNTYLQGKLTAAGQSVTLTITFNDGCSPSALTITAIDTSVLCATISPAARQYDLANRASQTTTITWNSASSITSVVDNGGTLTLGTHYTVVGNTLTILNTYLQGKLTAAGQSVTLTITFNVCSPSTLTITAVDTSVSTCAFISPTEDEYNLADRSDVTTLITWNDSSHVASIHDGTGSLAPGTHFTVHPYNGTARLAIKNAYLENKLTTAGASVALTITFNDGCIATLTIRAVDEPIVVGYTGSTVNKLTVMMPWLLLLTTFAAGASLLVLRRRQA
jgi:hypothetical protein